MKKILVTGATGNIGFELIQFLQKFDTPNKIVAGVRNLEKAKEVFAEYPNLEYVHFDFEDAGSFEKSLIGVDRVFLLRPPHISDVDKYFRPLIAEIKRSKINEVVFLSVQGSEKSKVIPHNKIERLIQESQLNYIFLRPSYFMQNLTTTLLNDIQLHRRIILPAGKAKYNWVDIDNIAEVGAILLNRFDEFQNSAFEITGLENANFEQVTCLINSAISSPIRYINVSPLKFFTIKKKQGMLSGMIIVMILLHFLPRFQKDPEISNFYERLTGKNPTDIKSFIEREKARFEKAT